MGFRLENDGRLAPIANSKINFPNGEGPAQIEFSPNGKFVAVTSGFQNEPASRIHNFLVQKDGTLAPVSGAAVQPNGASGVVGFSWAPDSQRLFVSNFRGSAIITLNVDPATGACINKAMLCRTAKRPLAGPPSPLTVRRCMQRIS